MDKLKMAHDYALKQMESLSENSTMQSLVSVAWQYADAMQAEAEKREPSGLPEALCEVDWRVAPCWAKEWVMRDGVAKWEYGTCANSWEFAPSFGFTGSHIVERPDGF